MSASASPTAAPGTRRILVLSKTPGIVKFLRDGWGEDCSVVAVRSVLELCTEMQGGGVDALFLDEELPSNDLGEMIAAARGDQARSSLPLAILATSRESELRQQLGLDGQDLVVDPGTPKNKVVAWIRDALRAPLATEEPPALDQDMASSIVEATKEVMQTMMGIEVTEGRLRVAKTESQRAEVIGSINVDGFVRGSITLFMGMELAETIAGRMLGDDTLALGDAELVDAIGELTNMIAGNIKTYLCKQRELFSMSTPTVTLGREVRRIPLRKDLAFLLPCTWQGHEMLVEVSLVPRAKRVGA